MRDRADLANTRFEGRYGCACSCKFPKRVVYQMNQGHETISEFWTLFGEAKFAEAGKLMHPELIVHWPNTREVFRGRDEFVAVNEKYPGRWAISLEKLMSIDDIVVSVAKVESPDQTQSCYATSFFTIQNGLIMEIVEYWSDNGEPPQWRIEAGLSERY